MNADRQQYFGSGTLAAADSKASRQQVLCTGIHGDLDMELYDATTVKMRGTRMLVWV